MTSAALLRPRAGEADPPAIGKGDYDRFAEFFRRRTGIVFPEHRESRTAQRLALCMVEEGAESFREFFLRLRADPGGEAMQRVVNALTVNETYFYRETRQFEQMTSHVLKTLVARRAAPGPVRILSVPCSTGEEPYSIALWLLENWAPLDRYDVEIMGVDIDTEVISLAREACYPTRSLSRLPQSVARRYFTGDERRGFHLDRDVVDAVSLSKDNLLSPGFSRRHPAIDVVFCRNLLIYFDDAGRRAAVNALYDCLNPGGHVFLGHSESLTRITSLFEPCRLGGHLLYRRPGGPTGDRP